MTCVCGVRAHFYVFTAGLADYSNRYTKGTAYPSPHPPPPTQEPSRPLTATSAHCEWQPIQTKLPLEKLTFGTSFSDHMLEWDWTLSGGWGPQSIHKHQHLKLDPAAATLHYALEVDQPKIQPSCIAAVLIACACVSVQCFEGMKAYKGPKGEIRLFRPELNMARMQRSMERLFLPVRALLPPSCVPVPAHLSRPSPPADIRGR